MQFDVISQLPAKLATFEKIQLSNQPSASLISNSFDIYFNGLLFSFESNNFYLKTLVSGEHGVTGKASWFSVWASFIINVISSSVKELFPTSTSEAPTTSYTENTQTTTKSNEVTDSVSSESSTLASETDVASSSSLITSSTTSDLSENSISSSDISLSSSISSSLNFSSDDLKSSSESFGSGESSASSSDNFPFSSDILSSDAELSSSDSSSSSEPFIDPELILEECALDINGNPTNVNGDCYKQCQFDKYLVFSVVDEETVNCCCN